jgi:acetyltransferase-like isoleucine patch superfamily enzyme
MPSLLKRSFARPDGWLARERRKRRYAREGLLGVLPDLQGPGATAALRQFGAVVGRGAVIHGPLHVADCPDDFSNLAIGNRVTIGPDVHLGLAAPIRIGDGARVSARVALLGRADLPAAGTAPLTVGAGAFIGEAAIIFPGVSVGDGAFVGPHAVVRESVPASATFEAPQAYELMRRV